MTRFEAGKGPISRAREAEACSQVETVSKAALLAALMGWFLRGVEERILCGL
jgi:hypothetical protein